MNPLNTDGSYGPLTKSIDIEEALTLITLATRAESVAAWRQQALAQLPQASLQRRQEIVAAVLRKFLQSKDDRFVETPLATLLASPVVEARLKRDLLLAQYLRTTPLVWEAIQQIALPRAEAATRPLAKAEDAEVTIGELDAFLVARLRQYTEATLSRTRNHITAHLAKFGLLEAHPVPGDRIAKRFYAAFYRPDPRAFWFSLATEFVERGWTSRSLDFVAGNSWTARGLLCCAGLRPLRDRRSRACRPDRNRLLRF